VKQVCALQEEKVIVSLRNTVRVDETRGALVRLANEIDGWFQGYGNPPQYQTQLDRLKSVLCKILNGLRTNLDSLDKNKSTGEVYDFCRIQEQRLVWLRDVWRYYGRKFDQRNDKDLQIQNVLDAADEIVWSCYTSVFRQANVPLRTVPLPYIEPLYTPKAIPRTYTRVLKDRVTGKFVNQVLDKLPIPVIGLPPNCVRSPWWLIYVGHEVGHHVQYDLHLDEEKLITDFGEWLVSNLPPEQQFASSRWSSWGQEIFADAFSVYNMGVWAAWAMAELEKTNPTGMLKEKKESSSTSYPSPIVRLYLMAELADKLGLDKKNALRGEDAKDYITETPTSEQQQAATDLEAVPHIVKAIETYQFDGLGDFARLCSWYQADHDSRGRIEKWTDGLIGKKSMPEETTWDTPRVIVSSGVAAWARVSAYPNPDDRDDAKDRLRQVLPEAIVKNNEGGVRSSDEEMPESELDRLGDEITQLFLETKPEELDL
jgi:hypothetical protein